LIAFVASPIPAIGARGAGFYKGEDLDQGLMGSSIATFINRIRENADAFIRAAALRRNCGGIKVAESLSVQRKPLESAVS
jgi:hypothetical protein